MMKSVFTLVAAVLIMLSASAQSLNGINTDNVTEENPELLFHTAAPGLILMPRVDMSQMMIAYDATLIPREGEGFIRWGKLDESGESAGLWTKWREFDDVITFATPGRYVLETYAVENGKENSSTVKATFRVDYIGMTMAPGIKLTPYGQRGYYVSLTSVYNDPVYYRWRHFEDDVWNGWRLYSEAVPFTEVGKYVLDARCENDPLSIYIEVPSIEYYPLGDVDHNGVVNVRDVAALINMLLNGISVASADLNQDGSVNVSDVSLLIAKLLNNN